MEKINLINQEKDALAAKVEKAKDDHGNDLQQLVNKLTEKEEEIQQSKKNEKDTKNKLNASQDRLKEIIT